MAELTNTRIVRIILFLLLIVFFCPFASGKVIYVDDNAAGANDGTSWVNAYVYLQDALADANSAEKPVEIRVAQGTYRPNEGLVAITEFDWRTTTFQLINGVTLKGGYAGTDSTDPHAYDFELYETILSGDIGKVDYVQDNCYHVVTANDTESSTVLDGLTITGGYADQGSDPTPFGFIEHGSCGAGLYNNGSLTIRNCTFKYNIAKVFGGGMFNQFSWQQQKTVLTNCNFTNNKAYLAGGGMYNLSNCTLTDCTFLDNVARQIYLTGYGYGGGGGMANAGDPNIVNCTFSKNSATSGGGMLNLNGSPVLENCTFVENLAFDIRLGDGGGIHTDNYNSKRLLLIGCFFRSNVAYVSGGGMTGFGTLANCTFLRNEAYLESGGGVAGGGILTRCTFSGNIAPQGGGLYGNGTLTNCIFSGNSASKGGGIYAHYRSPGGGRPKHTYTANDVGLYSDGDILVNCTFTGNVAVAKGHPPRYLTPITPAEGAAIFGIQVTVVNCVIWGNYPDQVSVRGSLSYCDIQGGQIGEHNIEADPCFAEPGYWADVNDANIIAEPNDPNAIWIDGDYHLKSQAGRWDPVGESWVKDDITSPCIDAGDPNSDFSGETWPHGGRINMGAFGGTPEASMSLETGGMSLPRVAYIFSHKNEAAESFDSLLGSYGCSTTLIKLDNVTSTPLDSYDLIIVAHDTQHEEALSEPNTIAAIENSGKPIVGLGDGGYDFFGLLGLSIGNPYGGHGSKNSIEVIDPNCSLFRTPYSIDIPEDRALQLYTETNHIGIYLWPTIPETVTVIGREVNDVGYHPLVMEQNRYLLWGFTESPQKMTEVGETLFINVVIWTANEAWESEN